MNLRIRLFPIPYATKNVTSLLVLYATTSSPLSSLNALLIRLNFSTRHRAHKACGRLPGSCKFSGCRLAKEMDLDEVALEGTLERDDGLDEQRVGVLEVEVHDGHHADAHELSLEEGAELLDIVGLDGGCDEFWLVAGAHRCGLDVLDDGHIWVSLVTMLLFSSEDPRNLGLCRPRTILLVYLRLHVKVDSGDDNVGEHVECAHAIQDIWVLKWHLLGYLHKPPTHVLVVRRSSGGCSTRNIQDDDEVGNLRLLALSRWKGGKDYVPED